MLIKHLYVANLMHTIACLIGIETKEMMMNMRKLMVSTLIACWFIILPAMYIPLDMWYYRLLPAGIGGLAIGVIYSKCSFGPM